MEDRNKNYKRYYLYFSWFFCLTMVDIKKYVCKKKKEVNGNNNNNEAP